MSVHLFVCVCVFVSVFHGPYVQTLPKFQYTLPWTLLGFSLTVLQNVMSFGFVDDVMFFRNRP